MMMLFMFILFILTGAVPVTYFYLFREDFFEEYARTEN